MANIVMRIKNFSKKKSIENEMEKAGKPVPIGTTAIWGDGKQYRKVSENNWQPTEERKSHKEHASGGPTKIDESEKLTPNKLHAAFSTAMENMSKENRAIFRNGKFDFEKKRYTSNDGKHYMQYVNGKITVHSNMEKADRKGPHKYIKRIPKKTGKGYVYFYTREQINQYQKDGTVPKQEKSSIWQSIMSFFGVKDEKQANEKTKELFTENHEQLGNVTLKTFASHLSEYLSNKESWDKKLSGSKKEKSASDKKKKSSSEKKSSSGEKSKSQWDITLMRKISGIVSGKKEGKKENQIESHSDTLSKKALASVDTKQKLMQQFKEEINSMNNSKLAREMFKNGKFDFENKTLTSEDGSITLKWQTRRYPEKPESVNNQQTSRGIVLTIHNEKPKDKSAVMSDEKIKDLEEALEFKKKNNRPYAETEKELNRLKNLKEYDKQLENQSKDNFETMPEKENNSNPKNKKEFVLKLLKDSGVDDEGLKALSDGYDDVMKERNNELKAISFLTDVLQSRTKESFSVIQNKINRFSEPEKDKSPLADAAEKLDDAVKEKPGKTKDQVKEYTDKDSGTKYFYGNEKDAIKKSGNANNVFKDIKPHLLANYLQDEGVFTDARIAIFNKNIAKELIDQTRKKYFQNWSDEEYNVPENRRINIDAVKPSEEDIKKYTSGEFLYSDKNDKFHKSYYKFGNDIVLINTDLLKFIDKHFPNGELKYSGIKTLPLAIVDNGKLQGVVMPILNDKKNFQEVLNKYKEIQGKKTDQESFSEQLKNEDKNIPEIYSAKNIYKPDGSLKSKPNFGTITFQDIKDNDEKKVFESMKVKNAIGTMGIKKVFDLSKEGEDAGVWTDSRMMIIDKPTTDKIYAVNKQREFMDLRKKWPDKEKVTDAQIIENVNSTAKNSGNFPPWRKVVPQEDAIHKKEATFTGSHNTSENKFAQKMEYSDGEETVLLNAGSVATLKSLFPNATMHLTGKMSQVVFKVGNEIKAVIMPMKKLDIDTFVNMKEMQKAFSRMMQELQKAKKAEIGETRTYKDGSKWRKVGPNKWEPVKEGKNENGKKPNEKKPDGKKPEKKPEKKPDEKQNSDKRTVMKDALKKVADILANALSSKETVEPTSQAIEKTGDNLKDKSQEMKKQQIENEKKKREIEKKKKQQSQQKKDEKAKG